MDRSDPEHMFDLEVSFKVGKKQLGKIIDRCIRVARLHLDRSAGPIKALGYKYSTKGASPSPSPTWPSRREETLISEAEKKVVAIEKSTSAASSPNDERYRLAVSEWEKTTKDVTDALQTTSMSFNPIYMMADSGARGSMAQIRQLAGMRGLMANTAGNHRDPHQGQLP